jgi:phosphoadenosine phosphosulfate reductase
MYTQPSNHHQPIPSSQPWLPANLDGLNRRFERLHPRQLLQWGVTTFSQDIVLATGFGPSGIVLMHLASQLRPKLPIFYLQTDLFFPETLALRDELAQRLPIELVEVHSGLSLDEQAIAFGPGLWQRNPDLCCQLRKVNPLRRFLSDKKAWISGIRRDQSATRGQTQLVAWDSANHLLKLNPLAHWRREQVWAYIHEHHLPYNTLHDDGYSSIGCVPCTSRTAANEAERAGRWAGFEKTECGIHVQPDGKITRRNGAAILQPLN